jgi:hypothetical protein
MKLTVLIPSEEYKSYAGARIRYGRVATELSREGIELVLEDISRFDPSLADCDALLVSKCHDAQSLVAAAYMSNKGALVGVDLFDDYFSDLTDSRLLRYQGWLSQLLGVCDFALCSTEPMAGVVRKFRKPLPIHIFNDPGPDIDHRSLSTLVARKLRDARDKCRIRVGWFGVGDNPYFPIGLSDLAAYAGALGELTRGGMDIEMTLLTNRRAITADGLALVQQLPVPAQIREWSETAERELLEDTILVFLPVNSQSFSRAKSLNRAVTALSAGCQILSTGHPLYSELDEFIYRDPKAFLDDLAQGTLRLSEGVIDKFCEALDRVASSATESRRLAAFFGSLERRDKGAPLQLTLIHGHSTRGEAHAMVKAVNGISVASPYCAAPLDFDVVFRGRSSDLEMLVSTGMSSRLLPDVRVHRSGSERIRGRNFVRVGNSSDPRQRRLRSSDSLAVELATYAGTMHEIERRMTEAFGVSRMIRSETSRLPLRVRDEAA